MGRRKRRQRRRERFADGPIVDVQPDAGPAAPLWSPTVLALIAANCVPLVGVALLDWDVRSILLLYWAESAVIGFFNIVKMIRIDPWPGAGMSVFFCVHYGGFMAGHLVFLIAITSGRFQEKHPDLNIADTLAVVFDGWMWVAVAALFVSHGFSYLRHYVFGDEPLPGDVGEQMMKPYARIVVMHVTLLLGAVLVVATGAPPAVLILLIMGKTAVDIHAHRREHRKRDVAVLTTV